MGKKWNNDFLSTFCAALNDIESDSPNAVDSGVEYSAIAALHDIESDSPNAVDSGVEYSAIAALDSGDDDRIECDGKIDESDNDVPVFPNEFFSYIINLTLQSNVTMLRTINRVSKLFKELATTAMYNRCLHIR